ncbi:hypothetical protein BN7_5866 [Wickerhamomyces ciferrii]|uniref:Chromatin structure-remodeling complex subunit n=1 Tax=Wickerhamomyces ciferrii (strain ATCC 14091 / BCRC 22168 / CBS 111 / JCM 3599 / NBRC 0793 / NRRL Y-1031 F-60-10) TaxID=1206466 RepID=K0KXW2_WICCF|nr:uncharacterized protein BN7_5866 [Wickerhamomyces ciferrii]CCH46274.1 hypothetical protein BN7_5866 [Wickerhamomyces ciferrii]
MPPRRSRSSASTDNTPRRSSRRGGSVEPQVDTELDQPLDIKEQEDEEYQEEIKDDDEDDEPYSGDDEDAEAPRSRQRSRSQRSTSRSKRVRTPAQELEDGDDEEEGEDEELDEELEEDDEENNKRQKTNSGTSTPSRPIRRGPGRGRKGPMSLQTPPPPPEDLKPLEMKDDEYIVTDDEEGEEKITPLGELKDGRQFRVRSFTVKGKGDRLYMLSTEPARCMGFRDSYLLFQKHRRLYKVVLTPEEKFDLINREIIPHSYKGRVIGLVTAKSIYKEFGAKIIVGGRNITDDYYAKKLREKGKVVEGELAEPEDAIPPKGTPYNQNQFVAWHGASSVYHGQVAPTPQLESLEMKSMKALKSTNHINEENWMYQHAVAVRQFDSSLLQGRQILSKGLKDPYTGIVFVPELTQPNRVQFKKIIDPREEDDGSKKKLIYETIVKTDNLAKHTGLKNVPLEIFDGVVSEEVKQAILQQQKYEELS